MQVSHDETKSSDGSVTRKHFVYVHSCNASPSHEHGASHHGHRGAQVHIEEESPDSLPNRPMHSDHEVGHKHQLRDRDFLRVMSFDGAQRPMATSTPSRRNTAMSSRHTQTRTPHKTRDGTFKLSSNLTRRETVMGSSAPSLCKDADANANRTKSNFGVGSAEYNPTRHSSSISSQSPRKRGAEGYTAATHSSPAHSYTPVSSSGMTSSVHSSPAHGHSNVRRSRSPGVSASIHKRSYGRSAVDHHASRRQSSNRVRHPTDSSTGSEERYHHRTTHRPSNGVGRSATVHDRTPRAYDVATSSAKHTGTRRYKSSHARHPYSEPDTSPEHNDVRVHMKPQVVKVIETPKLKKRVVYLASSTSSPEEVYYSEPGLFTPRSTSQRRRVVGTAGSSSRSTSRGNKGAGVRGARPRKVYVEPTDSVERVYIVQHGSDGSRSDQDQYETLEVNENDTVMSVQC